MRVAPARWSARPGAQGRRSNGVPVRDLLADYIDAGRFLTAPEREPRALYGCLSVAVTIS